MTRVIGRRREPEMGPQVSAQGLADVAQLTATLTALAPVGLMRKGIYRFRTHAEANEHQTEAIVARMATLARQRNACR